ncbi:L-threonylcarbamoyladenylate synthase [Parasphingorhabdus sp. JC815]|uniref:L-threonylcarbamoyladenylate synthase n=1 Tax=Parasphingorhabdus sp. JC815 TaxID=3232140 RepID=UPI0034592829
MSGSNDHIDDSARRYGNDVTGEAKAAAIAAAARRLQSGKLVAVPTETVYGLAADSTNADAIANIYRTKGRPDFNPLIVHVPHLVAARKLGVFNQLAARLAECFWPGPLTIVVPKTPDCPVAPAVTAGLDSIALRCPAHLLMQELLKVSGLFLAAPSANKSGGISPTIAAHVTRSLGNDAPMILDGGPCHNGVESTIVAVRGNVCQILRPGPVTREELETALGKAVVITDSKNVAGDKKIESPGQLSSHYAPAKPVRLNAVNVATHEYHIGFGTINGHYNLSADSDLAEAASRLFAAMHLADNSSLSCIAVAPVPDKGIGTAINDRLTRAAS